MTWLLMYPDGKTYGHSQWYKRLCQTENIILSYLPIQYYTYTLVRSYKILYVIIVGFTLKGSDRNGKKINRIYSIYDTKRT